MSGNFAAWTGEPPEAGVPAMPVTDLIMSVRSSQGEGRALGEVLARAMRPDKPDEAPDPDENAANMLARGYVPGQVAQLSQRLGDTLAELAAEREKIERGGRRQEQLRRAHGHGQLTAFDIARMDFDEGDPATVARLERRAESLQRQVAEASEMIAPQQQRAPQDPLELASRRARQAGHEAFVRRTAEMLAGRAAPRERRPFGSASRGGVAVRSEDCVYCTEAAVDDETSFLLHSDPELNVPVTSPERVAAQ